MIEKNTVFEKTESGDVKITTYEESYNDNGFLENNLVILTKYTIDKFLQEDNPGDLIALYTFYYYTAKWQGTNQTRCTDKYVKKGLNWGFDRFIKAKKKLLDFGLIEQIVCRKNNKIDGFYIKLNYIFKEKTQKQLLGFPTNRKQTINALSVNKGNSLSINNIASSEELAEPLKESSNRNFLNERMKKSKSSIEKKYDEIEIPLKRLLILVWEEVIKIHPKAKKESFFGSKELSICEKYYHDFKAGLSEKDFPAFFIRYKQNPEILSAAKKGFSDKELYNMLKEVLKKYDIEYYPENKSKLPSRLSSLFYNKQLDSVSYLIFFGMFEKSKKLLKPIPDQYPKLTEQVKKELFQDRNFSVSDENKLIRGIKNLIEIIEHENSTSIRSEITKGKYERVEIDVQLFRNFGSPEKIINNWLLFMQNTIDGWDKYEESLSIFTNAWIEKFFTWSEENLSVDLRKCDMKTLRDFHERKLIKEGKIILQEKTPEEKLKELEKRIKSSTKGSYNHERLIEEKDKLLESLKGDSWKSDIEEIEKAEKELLKVL